MPVFSDEPVTEEDEVAQQDVVRANLIVVTQSCDLENNKAPFVALCPIHTIVEFSAVNPKFRKDDVLESVRKGRTEGLHLLASPDTPENNRAALIVDFG